jgi:hypothetical protein
MNTARPRRRGAGNKRLDMTEIRSALRDERRWTAIGVIVANTDGSPHWRVEMDGSEAVDIMVDVVLQPSQVPIECRLQAGMWIVPRIGEEVAVSIPDGQIDFLPCIIGILSSNEVPTVQGPTPDRMVFERDEIVAHDGEGGAVPVAIASDLTALKTAIQNAVVISGDGGASLKSTLLAALAGWPHPTTVFKAK